MNTQNDTPTRIRISEDEVQTPVRQPKKRKPNTKVLSLLQLGMLASGAVIVVLALVLLILPMFKINNIVVEGNQYYNDDEVAAMAGIAVGDELFGWDMQTACNSIMEAYPYASDIYVSIQFFTVKIEIVEKTTVMYAAYQNQYFSFDRDLRVLEMKTDGEEAFSPFLRVKLPALAVSQVGYKLQFANAELDPAYLTDLLDLLSEGQLLSSVTYIDFSERFSLSFVLSNSTRVEIGDLKDMAVKLTLVKEELNKNSADHNIYAVIDVSNTNKPIYRQISVENLYD